MGDRAVPKGGNMKPLKTKNLAFLALLLFQLTPPLVHAQTKQVRAHSSAEEDEQLSIKCVSIKASKEVKACITRTMNSTSNDIMYYFHGAFGNERSWV